MAFFQADALCKKFGTLKVIEDFSFSMEKGEHLTLFASSGAGKSTLLRILAGLDKSHTGNVRSNASAFSFVMQDCPLFPHKTVKENIFYPLVVSNRRCCGQSKAGFSSGVLKRYEQWLEVTGLCAFEMCYPYSLSGGMKQKVAIIRAFITSPDLVFLDEPFKSLDLKGKQTILRFIHSAYPEVTTILVTHALEEIPLLTQRMLIFDDKPLRSYRSIRISGQETIADLATVLFPIDDNQ
ncbi:MAG: ABC transporter ATP-binding protein [Chitinivibrionales bacterium]|nr:ABC transporter ATP-binding protein [Chitinivibrionales bacterium]